MARLQSPIAARRRELMGSLSKAFVRTIDVKLSKNEGCQTFVEDKWKRGQAKCRCSRLPNIQQMV